jgi:hypothetical protein
MLLDELQHPSLDDIVQLSALARRARIWRERVYEVRETVQHEHGAVPRAARTGPGTCMSTESRVLLPCGSNAHPYSRIDERVKRTLNRRAVFRTADIAITVIVPLGFGFCRVQSEDRAQVLCVR